MITDFVEVGGLFLGFLLMVFIVPFFRLIMAHI